VHTSPRPGSPDSPLWDPTAIPAATVIVVRDSNDGPTHDEAGVEVLMLRRDSSLAFAGGAWVFPGGRIDPADLALGGDPEGAARIAAVREAAEEASLLLEPARLRRWSHWTPPPDSPRRRFSTAFFVTPVPSEAGEVRIDNREIREHRWQRPVDVLAARDDGTVTLTPPTFITLCQLAPHRDVASIMRSAEGLGGERPVEHFATRVAHTGASADEIVVLYHGDAGYDSGDASLPGPRHRLRMGPVWRYERDT
jgi:8-oxo-dGTP pyrophosphatase MutT (NUDIX family)